MSLDNSGKMSTAERSCRNNYCVGIYAADKASDARSSWGQKRRIDSQINDAAVRVDDDGGGECSWCVVCHPRNPCIDLLFPLPSLGMPWGSTLDLTRLGRLVGVVGG